MKKRRGKVKKGKTKAKKEEDEGGEKKAIMGILLALITSIVSIRKTPGRIHFRF